MGELRDEIANTIRDNISVTLHNTGDEYADWEIDNYDDVADRILAIPRLQEALEVAKRAGELPRGKEAW